MLNRKRLVLCCLPLICTLSACTTVPYEETSEAVRQRSELSVIRNDIQRIQGGLDNATIAQEGLQRKLGEIESDLARLAKQMRDDAGRCETGLKTAEQKRHEMQVSIVDDLSRKMAGLIKSSAAASPRPTVGVEHVVRRGETLSEIASAYRTRIAVIIEANKLANPDRLVEGQTLFIPE